MAGGLWRGERGEVRLGWPASRGGMGPQGQPEAWWAFLPAGLEIGAWRGSGPHGGRRLLGAARRQGPSVMGGRSPTPGRGADET